MFEPHLNNFSSIFSISRQALGTITWGRVMAALDKDSLPQHFIPALSRLKQASQLTGGHEFPDPIVDLARIELARHGINQAAPAGKPPDRIMVNPNLTLIPVDFSHLVALFSPGEVHGDHGTMGRPSPGHAMVWQDPNGHGTRVAQATNEDLLALKIVVEEIPQIEAAAQGNTTIYRIQNILDQAVEKGIILTPPSRIRRDLLPCQDVPGVSPFVQADVFTLQWHITQACDLHCKHCYDRSNRKAMSHPMALQVLDDLDLFCREMNVHGQVTFTGGNPFLHPRFLDIYRAARDKGFTLAILGNPTPMAFMERLVKIALPRFFQISLEGLAPHNDDIRGQGHFDRSLAFLEQLKGLGICTMVMLTLTRDNIDQVLPLAEILQNRADHFTFTRLATIGEGARLKMPEKKQYETFLREYENKARTTPLLGLKDNLLNIIRWQGDSPLFGGCTGFGCGAAFNFVSLLPEGEVHACRKFPSPIGHTRFSTIKEIYGSDRARAHRRGSLACQKCPLFAVCRGCAAITHSCGLNPLGDKDPFCFMADHQDPDPPLAHLPDGL